MTIAVEIPEEIAKDLVTEGKNPARAVLEAVALDGYRRDRLSEYQVRLLLAFETRMEVHEFLKERGVFLHYTLADVEHDMREADRYIALKRANNPTEPRE